MTSSSLNINNKVIIVTGFGPFGPHKVNDSWICAQKLKNLSIEDELGITLITHEIPVVYTESDNAVPLLWEKYNPALVVHVGVHNTENIVIERAARKTGYHRPDVSGCCPSTTSCPSGINECIDTMIDLNDIVKCVDSRGIHLSVSNDAGNYLCEYTYYLSLCQNPRRTIFVHIPPAGTTPSIEDKTFVLKNIISAVYKQISDIK